VRIEQIMFVWIEIYALVIEKMALVGAERGIE
jgi:hypothetical protein